MEQRLTLVTLGVADLAASAAFYERLGWRRTPFASSGIVFFDLDGGLQLALYPRDALAEDIGLVPSAPSPAAGTGPVTNVTLAHNVASRAAVDAILGDAVTAGAALLKPAADTFWGGYSGYFSDPDGFCWEIATMAAADSG